jgi:SOS response regulatory protein OraA/RecX
MRELRNRGISQDVSTSVIEEVYSEIDETDLSERALARRLKGPIESPAEMRRLYQYLIRQGFEGWLAQSILRTHTTQPEVDDDGI